MSSRSRLTDSPHSTLHAFFLAASRLLDFGLIGSAKWIAPPDPRPRLVWRQSIRAYGFSWR